MARPRRPTQRARCPCHACVLPCEFPRGGNSPESANGPSGLLYFMAQRQFVVPRSVGQVANLPLASGIAPSSGRSAYRAYADGFGGGRSRRWASAGRMAFASSPAPARQRVSLGSWFGPFRFPSRSLSTRIANIVALDCHRLERSGTVDFAQWGVDCSSRYSPNNVPFPCRERLGRGNSSWRLPRSRHC